MEDSWTGTMKRKCISNTDLKEFLESFDNWQNLTETLMKEKSELTETVSSLSNDKQKLVSRNNELQNEISNLQAVIDSTHKSLHRICDVEEENRQLKTKCESLKCDIEELYKTIAEHDTKHLQVIEGIQKDNDNQQDEFKKSFKIAMENEKENHKKLMLEMKSEIEDLKEKLLSASRETETEIVRVSMEYENKLAKLRQKIPSSVSHSSSSNQEIFRMKLQHMKNEYEREVRLLREQIAELEEKVSQGNNRMTFTANKKRRF